MVDATRRKLRIPNWYSPYLEKHRVYELFHELARELVIQQPQDHVLFLRQVLSNASQSRHAPRIVFLAPPHVNTHDIAYLLADKCGATVVTEKDILSMLPTEKHVKERPKIKTMIKCLNEALRINNIYHTGWILPDYPKSRREAKCMQQAGILASHVLHFLPEFSTSVYDLNVGKYSDDWMEHRRTILGIKDAFKHNLKEIYMNKKTVEEIVGDCVELVNIKQRCKAPIIPRICLVGPRGSGRKTQAKLLAKTFNLIHVDFEYLLCQACMSESHLGHLIRQHKTKADISSVLLAAVVHKRILDDDCLHQGWVLSGFPRSLDDLKNLDMFDTPPNRVLFLECTDEVCLERLTNRRMNVYSGSVVHILQNPTRALDLHLATHPKDTKNIVTAQLKQFRKTVNAMKRYCGQTAQLVEAGDSVQWVFETLSALVMRPLVDCEPRCPTDAVDYQSDTTVSEEYCVCYCSDEGDSQ
ncbi:uncharacterized protein CBL_12166 [Carabus blaptoides fortunei]